MSAWQELVPFPEVIPALERLRARYRLVVLSNGDPHFLQHLVKNRIQWEFDDVISVAAFSAFKPHPGVYRGAAGALGLEVGECMMVSSNSFDVVGARACGYRAAFVDRYRLSYEDSPYRPDVIVNEFTELADTLL
jgi:2-haloacid dehalogenase